MNKAGSEEEGLMEDIFREQVEVIGTAPVYGSPRSAGADLITIEKKLLKPMERWLAPNGIKMAIPRGHFGLVCPRSGLAIKKGVTVLNGSGVIDSDYRGFFFVPLINLGQEDVQLEVGERIAQLVIIPYVACAFIKTESLDETQRGSGGFGSTGS